MTTIENLPLIIIFRPNAIITKLKVNNQEGVLHQNPQIRHQAAVRIQTKSIFFINPAPGQRRLWCCLPRKDDLSPLWIPCRQGHFQKTCQKPISSPVRNSNPQKTRPPQHHQALRSLWRLKKSLPRPRVIYFPILVTAKAANSSKDSKNTATSTKKTPA